MIKKLIRLLLLTPTLILFELIGIYNILAKDIEGIYILAFTFRRTKRYKRAIWYLNRLLEIDPHNQKATVLAASIYCDSEIYDKALQYYLHAKELFINQQDSKMLMDIEATIKQIEKK